MSHVIKVSAKGYDIEGKETSPEQKQKASVTAHMLSGIAVAFLQGAETSLHRYIDAATTMETNINYIFVCLHELSSLMEHLDSVDRYMIMCGTTDPLHERVRDIRNHIRHDLRDNLSQENNDGRKKRAKKLGINESLLVDIRFARDQIKIGTTVIGTDEISGFIQRADNLFKATIKDGIEKGFIEGAEFSNDPNLKDNTSVK